MRSVTEAREAGMDRTQEPGGDYGYDEAHQDVQKSAGGQPPDGAESAPERSADTAGDYSYDEAHDF
jgi:hypothetical protein